MTEEKTLFVEFNTVNDRKISELWTEFCDREYTSKREEATDHLVSRLGFTILRDRVLFEQKLYQQIVWDGCTISFDHFKMNIVPETDLKDITSVDNVKILILEQHTRSTPALAVKYRDVTVVGGWV